MFRKKEKQSLISSKNIPNNLLGINWKFHLKIWWKQIFVANFLLYNICCQFIVDGHFLLKIIWSFFNQKRFLKLKIFSKIRWELTENFTWKLDFRNKNHAPLVLKKTKNRLYYLISWWKLQNYLTFTYQ